MSQTKAQRRYDQSEKGKARHQHYEQSEIGKTARLRAKLRYRTTIIGHLRRVFNGIEARCDNPKHIAYKYYGGRGIKCLFESSDEFVDYIINILQVDPRGLDIDRINNDGNYEVGNIRFVTCSENLKNRRKWKWKRGLAP